jgi:uncharacterized membrane protein YcaP (DUF421 family)
MITIFIRTIIVYVFLLASMKLGGKRQIGELQLSELVTALLLSEIAAIPIGHEDIPIFFVIIPILTVVCLEIICAFILTKSRPLKKIFNGSPSIIINKGEIDKEELLKLHLGIDDLICEARLKGISDIASLEYAIFEDNGKLSVFEKAKKGEKETGIAHIIIEDGSINKFGMKMAGLSENALNARLKSKHVPAEKVFLYTVNDAGEENWIFGTKKKVKKKRKDNK